MRVRSLLFFLSATLVRADFIVSVSNNSNTSTQIQRYSDSGAFIRTMVNTGGGLITPEGLAYGADGYIYVADFSDGKVNRYLGETGVFLSTFIHPGVNDSAVGLEFGPNGNLYTSNYYGSSFAVAEFNSITRQLVPPFQIAAGSGGLAGPRDIGFDPSGNLLVSSAYTNQVLRYDANTGAFLGVAASGGLSFPDGLAVDAVQNILYVASSFSDQVLKFNALTGASLGTFATLPTGADPTGLLIQPNGNLLVTGNGSQSIYQYSPTGTLLTTFGNSQFAAVNGFPTYMAQIPSLTEVPEPYSAGLVFAGSLVVWSLQRKRSSSAAKRGGISSIG